MEEALPASAYSLQPIGLLPEIRIDTSRLDVLLSGFQRRLTALEASFERVAESAAEAAHKVVMTSSPRNTAPPSPVRTTVSSPRPPRSPSPASSELTATVILPGVTGEPPPSARKQDFQLETAGQADSNQGESPLHATSPTLASATAQQEPSQAKQGPAEEQEGPQETKKEPSSPGQEGPIRSLAKISIKVEEPLKAEDCVVAQHPRGKIGDASNEAIKAEKAVMKAVAEASTESLKNTIQPQVEALWDAVKWMEDRMEAIDAERRGELEDASRTAAQNTAKAEVAKMERERIKLALEDRPVRSEFEALNDLQEGRLRTTETELRRLVAELSNRLQEELHGKIDKLYEDTSDWKTRLDNSTKLVDERVRHLEHELEDEIRGELGDSELSEEESDASEDSHAGYRRLSTPMDPSLGMSPRSARMTPRSGRGRRSILMQRVRDKRESGFHKKLDQALSISKNGEMELSAAIASIRAELAQLLLRMEEGELQKDRFVREVDDRVCEGGQEVEVSLSRLKDELLEELGAHQMETEKLSMQIEKAVTPEILNEALRGSDTIRDVATKAFSLEESVASLLASLKNTEKKLVQANETSSQGISEAERRMSARIQTVANAHTAVHEQLEKKVFKLKDNKADKDSLQETRDELALRLTTLENVTTAGKQEVIDLLTSEVETVSYRILEVENLTEAVRTDLSPEIAALEEGVHSVHGVLKRALEDHQRILDTQDAKVTAVSKEVSDACSSVTSDVRDMLVCLVSSGARRELERKNDPGEESTLAEASAVATAIREQQRRREESSRRVERANLSLTLLVKKLERSLFVLSSRDLFWEEVGTKLKAHAEAFADASCRVEVTSEEQDRFVLTVELQQYIAGNTQRVAKLICQKADFEVIQKLTASTNTEKGAQDWDRRVQNMRGSFLEHFVVNARRYLDRKYPSHGPFGARNRDRFFVKLEEGLKV
ncbi:unnamed protein product, partial [Ectocarpus fasciculatus]